MTRKPVCIVETIKIHLAVYNFIIVGDVGDEEGYLLHVNTLEADIQKKITASFFNHSDLDHLKQVRDAVIEAEKNSEFFIALAGDGLFNDISRKILHLKKPKKEKVFSMRFDRELKARFAERCERSGRSQSEAMRTLMEYYISMEFPP